MAPIRVLIVDDLPFMRVALRDALASDGFDVAGEAANGVEALTQYARLRPDAVLLDIAMPVMDGIVTLERLMRREPAACVVMCSAIDEEPMIIRAIRLGARDFVVKPFTPQRVRSALRAALRFADP